jgi:ABC-2 type transport system ATP-binding protein
MSIAGETHQEALSTRHLYKRYRLRPAWALEDVDIGIPSGAIAALVGPNGAGKSTLVRTWLGFERPTKGAVFIEGVDVAGGSGGERPSVAYVPQASVPWRGLSIGEHVEYAAMLRPDFDRNAARMRLAALRLPLDAPATTLSGGERAQLILALALATRARVLLLDEPLASLDPLARREFLRVLRAAILENRQTVVLSSHIVSDIESVCDWLVVLKGGHVVLEGSIESVLSDHQISGDAGPSGVVIGRYLDIDGSPRTLVRGGVGGRPTLEEVVVGYLAGSAPTPEP